MKAIITVTTIQKIDGESNKTEMITEGTFEPTDYGYLAAYAETADTGYQGAHLDLMIYGSDKIHILRSGAVDSELLIDTKRKNFCQYGTPYGNLTVGILGTKVVSDLSDSGGSVYAEYVIDFNSTLVGEYEMTITVKTEN